ncbi:UPF0182 family protein [Pseudonocardia petroleophila]|uniref:UPF0182 protein H6H00_01245 n=1 Tax=Pseudonocardia petroleophila TaxID=37331 RepID=A0A7G7MIW8_9PSEU|nr:UPF0182 family protein [Pseudonocardia petroleophila]QNG52729.1 UPF0182 family protein [Pseudonocardia petroleophila]
MTDRPPTAARGLPRRRWIGIAVAGAVLVSLAGSTVLGTYVDWLWFDALDYRDLLVTVLLTRAAQFLVAGALVGGLLAGTVAVALRFRPPVLPADVAGPVAELHTLITRRPWVIRAAVPSAVGVLAGLAAQGDWRTTQLFLHGGAFGVTDPEFGLDIGFHVFDLPFYHLVLGWALVATVLSLLGAALMHLALGGLVAGGRGVRMTPAATAHLAVLAATVVLLLAAELFLDRYELLYSQRNELFTGATYTDLYAVLPAKLVLTGIAVICALTFLGGALRRDLRLPVIATALLVVSSVLVGAVWPALLQQFSVNPNADQREALSIGRNIEATRAAYGITDDRVSYVDYSGTGETTPARLAAESATVSNIRLLDPTLLEQTFTQLQQRENFYGFPAELDVDRYRIDGELQGYVVALRELETASLAGNQRSWINQHLRYTHGDGFVAARADRVDATPGGVATSSGYPVFTVSDTTGDGEIPVAQPRVYYGELIDSYVIVGGDPGDPAREFELDGTEFTYDGSGGVPIGGWLRRLAFAAHFGERNILFNEAVGAGSTVLMRQHPLERVEAAAPWLTVDGDPYPAVVDGRITWIVDGYTTLDRYPYAEQASLGTERVGYVRDSVKATVDAYDGTVTLYAVDPADPVLQAWSAAFPGTVRPASEISDELRAHFRYPQDLFDVQRDLITPYHVDDPQLFFSTSDFWDVPADPTVEQAPAPLIPTPAEPGPGEVPRQPPHYVLAGPPAAEGPARFQLTSPLVGLRRQFLAAHMSVSSAPASYGDIRVLRLPGDAQTLGPQQVQTRFRSSAEVSEERNLLQATATNVQFGNLLTLPTGDGTLLHVEPVYVERTTTADDDSFPQLNRVLVLYGDRVGYAPTLAEALDEAAGAGAGTVAESPTAPGPVDPTARAAAADVSAALERLRAAKAAGDLAAEGQALIDLDDAARRFTAATGSPA